ncbi:Uncharacterised protein [Shewanella morhuae]|uniref:Uncharacterized protein n=1 Tax=Shewanella morhuae TaxID=365591 RepID=A0A380BTD6_9GAMM|nr:Uncharacterised protein [Shewanella morhuae]
MKHILDYFKNDPEADFEQGSALNEANKKRNWVIAGVGATGTRRPLFSGRRLYVCPKTYP